MIKLINILSGERHTASTPIGLENLKASWRFSTDFPVAVDRGISSENLKFYRLDRDWLLAVFDEFGTSAVVDLEFTSDLLSFSVALDFTTATWDEVFFEVGYKFSRLADKIKELDEVGKVEVGEFERVEYQLNTSVQSVAEQKGQADFDKNYLGFEKTTIAGSKKLVTVLGGINAIGLPDIYGVEVAKNIGTAINTAAPIAPITVGSTDCEIAYNEEFCSLISWYPADAADAFTLGHIKGRWGWGCWVDNNISSVTSHFMLILYAQYSKNGSPDVWRQLSRSDFSKTYAAGYMTFNFQQEIDEDMNFPTALSTTYGGVEYDRVEVHLVMIPRLEGDLATGLAVNKWVNGITLYCYGVTISHSLSAIDRNVFLLPVNRYFEKLGLFDNQAAAVLAPTLLTSHDFMSKGDTLQIKPTDVMHDVSLLYALKFVEKDGKYTIMRLDEPSGDLVDVSQFTDLHFTAIPSITGAKMAERSTSDTDTKYPEQIFTGTAAIADDRIPANLLQLSTNLTTDGGQILQELMSGNGTTAYLFHAHDVPTRQLTPPELGRQINEFFMFREIVSRLMPFVASWMRPLQPLTLTDCDPYYNPTTGTGSTDTITPPSPIYGSAVIAAKIPVNFALVRAILGGCKRLRLNGTTIAMKDIEINTEPSVAEVSGFIEL